MKKLSITAALLCGLTALTWAARTDKFIVTNQQTGGSVRITSDMNIVQSGTVGSNNAMKSLDVTGTQTVSSTATFSDALILAGEKISTPTNFTIGSGTTTTATSEFALFVTTGTGAIVWTATPSITTTTATNGQFFEIMSSTTTDITLKDNDSTSGTLLEMFQNTASRVLSNPGDIISFRYYNGKWYEVDFSTH